MDRKTGVVQVASKRGFCIVRVGPESSLERYFLHVSKIRSGTATPAAGMTVVFDVSDKPVQEGQLPQAIRADVIVPEVQSENTAAPVDPSPANDGKDGAL
jgi:cold shock CspA family protein